MPYGPNTQGPQSEPRPLTSMPSGSRCVFVDVIRRNPKKRPMGRRGRRGFFGRGHRGHRSRRKEFRQIQNRIMDLGLTRGATMKVLQGGCQGPVLIEVRGTRLALGQDLASRILVQAV
ncbi:MAG: hypothetical protein GF309_06715 [Candidatus Lokiarchaeota archaeon]|nr:hypothetical protein [Candidatus Lokiarchaeota archaeon]